MSLSVEESNVPSKSRSAAGKQPRTGGFGAERENHSAFAGLLSGLAISAVIWAGLYLFFR